MSPLISLFYPGLIIQQEFIITPETKKAFQQCSKDLNPLHNDKYFALEKGFKDVVMYGNILNCFLSFFVGEKLPTKEVIIHNQEIKYCNPSYMGDKLLFTAKVVDVIEAVNTVIFKYNFKNQSDLMIAKGKIQIGIISDIQ